MESKDLEEKVRKNVTEKIAISNIRKEFDMKNNRNRNMIYWITSSVAVFVLGFGIVVGKNALYNLDMRNSNYVAEDLIKNKENLKINLQINKVKEIATMKLDADTKTTKLESLPNELKFMENIQIPKEFKPLDIYAIYIRSNPDIKKYDLLHDYVFEYKKDEEHEIRIALSMVEKPIRDYYIEENNKTSRIGDIELKINKYKEMYITNFKIKNIYFDIETNGITENELVGILKDIYLKIL